MRFLSLLLSLTILGSNIASADDVTKDIEIAGSLSRAFENVAKIIRPSVVNISSEKRLEPAQNRPRMRNPSGQDPFKEFFGDEFMERFFGQPMNPRNFQQGLGTGVIVDSNGHILTNNHVVAEADKINVRLQDNREFVAKLVGTDPKTDLAVIKIEAKDLTPASLGDSESLKIGEWVVAAGNPFGFDNSITSGIVSAKSRSISGGSEYQDFIQTDAAINPGNSGGPLVNLHGQVVGINTAIFTRSGGYMGIGFSIPINMAKSVMDALITDGRVVRGELGVIIQNLTADLAQSFGYSGTDGALVGDIKPGSAADRGGIKQGDIITKYGAAKIKDINQLRNLVAATKPKDKVDVLVFRDGKEVSLSFSIGEQKAEAPKDELNTSATDMGLTLQNLTPEIARQLGSKREAGLVVTQVEPGSLAERAGIQMRDIIINIAGKKPSDANQFFELLQKQDLKKGVRLVVETNGMERFVFLRE